MSTDDTAAAATTTFERRVGHPPGLFVLFFAEMWERFSYYGMRALLVFYMTKGFLRYADNQAYAVYGAYTALVYATPFIGGMLADRLLGARRAVILGGSLMAMGHLVMTVQTAPAFFTALALLIVGNGFFKPNIGTIVGSLYAPDSPKRDGGFTLFYMGVNLGAALSPLLCGYIGETYGWHYGFGLATVGMLIGLSIFVAPTSVTRAMIVTGAVAAAGLMFYGVRNDAVMLAVNTPVALALLVAAGIAAWATLSGGVPETAGSTPFRTPAKVVETEAPAPKTSNRTGVLAVLGGVAVAVPLIALLVQRSTLAGYMLSIFGGLALLSVVYEAVRSEKVERQRLMVVLISMFFSMLFWAFFEQAGSSINNFTDRNVDRVRQERVIDASEVGRTIPLRLTQEQVGHRLSDGTLLTLDALERRRGTTPPTDTVQWTVRQEDVGMGVGGAEVKASVFQATNPIFILLFGLAFTALWGALAKRGREPSTPVKFGMGLMQLGLGFGVLWYGTTTADARGMVWVGWLLLGYLLHTTGELCLSPVGLSMVTKLSPRRMVSTLLGAWYLATAFSNFLAGLIATLTGVTHGGGETGGVPPPSETVHVYGEVFGKIGVAACVSALVMWALSPLLTKWMHMESLHGPPDAAKH